MGGGGKGSCFLLKLRKDSGAGPRVGAIRPDHNGSDVSADGARDEPEKNQGNGVHPGLIWGNVGGLAYNRRGNLQ